MRMRKIKLISLEQYLFFSFIQQTLGGCLPHVRHYSKNLWLSEKIDTWSNGYDSVSDMLG
jgi:hypothetical protein